jgi:hypothetical protein
MLMRFLSDSLKVCFEIFLIRSETKVMSSQSFIVIYYTNLY